MDKQQIISFIQNQVAQGNISRDDLAALAGIDTPQVQSVLATGTTPNTVVSPEHSSRNLINVFYIIGAIIVLIGVIILLGQNWDDIGFIGRVGSTLGIALVTYLAGLTLSKSVHDTLSQVMFMLSAVLAPFGTFILLDEMNVFVDISAQVVIALVFVCIYSVAQFVARKNILTVVIAGYATWAYYAFLLKILDNQLFDNDIIIWATMLLGISYCAVAYGYSSKKVGSVEKVTQRASITHLFYGAGTLAILGGGISLGGMWDLPYIVLIFATFYLSVFVKNRAMLVIAAAFLVGHIIKLTSKYFLDSVGWPLALIICGFAVIGVGYMTYYVNRKYLAKKY
ncbi:MAG: DUF2157 domain-containing protein [Patescibacteria group bacterium]